SPFLCPASSIHASRTTTSSTLSLHDALPIYHHARSRTAAVHRLGPDRGCAVEHRRLPAIPPFRQPFLEPDGARRYAARARRQRIDRKSTRLNSSHVKTSYAVFSFKKKTSENL